MVEHILEYWQAWAAIGTGGLAVIFGTVELRGGKLWAPRSVVEKVQGIEVRLLGVENEQSHYQKTVIDPLGRLEEKLDGLLEGNGSQNAVIATLAEGQKGLGHGLDNLRGEVSDLREDVREIRRTRV